MRRGAAIRATWVVPGTAGPETAPDAFETDPWPNGAFDAPTRPLDGLSILVRPQRSIRSTLAVLPARLSELQIEGLKDGWHTAWRSDCRCRNSSGPRDRAAARNARVMKEPDGGRKAETFPPAEVPRANVATLRWHMFGIEQTARNGWRSLRGRWLAA